MGRLAIKRLTNSDLTLFEYHFRNNNAGNQKSINLNANVFVEALYPQLGNTESGRIGRLPLDLYLYGPSAAPVLNIQRKILKGRSYKNWRLNGEFISAPQDDADRFNVLREGDFAIFDFEGDLVPSLARVVLVASQSDDDRDLHKAIEDTGIRKMAAIEYSKLRLIANAGGVAETHPVHDLLLESAIEDASQLGIEGITRLLNRAGNRAMSRRELELARQRASDIGREGEGLIDGYLLTKTENGELDSYEWSADENAISPFDFRATSPDLALRKIEVKSTRGSFGQVIHLSYAELLHAAGSEEPYDIYRVYALEERTAELRVYSDFGPYAKELLTIFVGLPAGVTCDGISIRPEQIEGFAASEKIELPDDPFELRDE